MVETYRLHRTAFEASEVVALANISIELPLRIVATLRKGIKSVSKAVIQNRQSNYIIFRDEL